MTQQLAAIGVHDQEALDLWTAVLTGLTDQQISNDPGGSRWTQLVDRCRRHVDHRVHANQHHRQQRQGRRHDHHDRHRPSPAPSNAIGHREAMAAPGDRVRSCDRAPALARRRRMDRADRVPRLGRPSDVVARARCERGRVRPFARTCASCVPPANARRSSACRWRPGCRASRWPSATTSHRTNSSSASPGSRRRR
jgi:hypothetical protein